jgi:hypothetical protein
MSPLGYQVQSVVACHHRVQPKQWTAEDAVCRNHHLGRGARAVRCPVSALARVGKAQPLMNISFPRSNIRGRDGCCQPPGGRHWRWRPPMRRDQRMREALSFLVLSCGSQERATEYGVGDREVDHETRDINERRDEGCRGGSWVEAEPFQHERQHRSCH